MSSITNKINESQVSVVVSFSDVPANPFMVGKNKFRNAVCKDLGILPVDSKVSTNYGKKNRTASVILHFAYAASATKIADKARQVLPNAQVKVVTNPKPTAVETETAEVAPVVSVPVSATAKVLSTVK